MAGFRARLSRPRTSPPGVSVPTARSRAGHFGEGAGFGEGQGVVVRVEPAVAVPVAGRQARAGLPTERPDPEAAAEGRAEDMLGQERV